MPEKWQEHIPLSILNEMFNFGSCPHPFPPLDIMFINMVFINLLTQPCLSLPRTAKIEKTESKIQKEKMCKNTTTFWHKPKNSEWVKWRY